ncbi:hypothetical protein B9Z55_012053 [Caenorhabditis nigoni]|uniref:DUF38 domain-containing protein n=1 Tax=Caenorhabditis nigoni TaxID=1611254 RepID=A0A2G5TVH1_9PELO|nr:hypothetical protein B9Z55_012053 [Caenorhabditis nigoni]
MRILIALCLVVSLVWSKDPKDSALQKARFILKKMDKALESRNLAQFLKMHDKNFQFQFCKTTGKSVSDLEHVLKTDPYLSQTVVSKHHVSGDPSIPLIEKVGEKQWSFKYDEYLMLKDNVVYRSQGSITFIDDGANSKIIYAEEKCPQKIF